MPLHPWLFLLPLLTVAVCGCAAAGPLGGNDAGPVRADYPARPVAVITTVYHHNSHADVIASRLLQTDTLDGQGRQSSLQLVSLYTDQVHEKDISRKLAAEFGFPICPTVEEALTLGTGKLAVDGVLLIAEHGKYQASPTGQVVYPKRRLFEQIVAVFRKTGRVVPVFVDKHLADNWADAWWIYDTARQMKIPLLAGSSLPGLWRRPPADVPAGAALQDMVAVSYHTLDAYGFHALEMVQCLAEQRRGGESGIAAVRTCNDAAVWAALDHGEVSADMLKECLARLTRPVTIEQARQQVKHPVLFQIRYEGGLTASVLTLNNAVGEWSVAWRIGGDEAIHSTLFWTQEARPFMHFTFLLEGIEQMVQTGIPPWSVERTLLSSGALDALLISQKKGDGAWLPTPQLLLEYRSSWRWQEPPPPPAGRPIMAQ